MTATVTYMTPPDATLAIGVPQRLSRKLCVLFLLASLGSAGLALSWSSWAGQAPDLLRLLPAAMALVFLVIGARPRHWKAWVYFKVDYNGLWFPARIPQPKQQAWLRVPWVDVKQMQVLPGADGRDALVLELAIDSAQQQQFFAEVHQQRNTLLDGNTFSVAYRSFFVPPNATLQQLKALQS
ncbi:hypothetical protein [Alcanivorax hongdengensis]|nr:hypothetical protein [Alcanivorax hongdengensis]